MSGTAIDLADLKVVGYDGSSNGDLEVQTLDEYGDSDRTFTWLDYTSRIGSVKFYGWYEDGDTPYDELDDDEKVTLQPGEGLFAVSYADDLMLQSSGQVPQEDVETELAAADEGKLIVNPTPVPVDLGDCIVSGYEGSSNGDIEVQTLDEYGDSDRSFTWLDYTSRIGSVKYYGWYEDGDTSYDDLDDEEKVILQPGQGLFSVSYGDDFTFVWPGVKIAE